MRTSFFEIMASLGLSFSLTAIIKMIFVYNGVGLGGLILLVIIACTAYYSLRFFFRKSRYMNKKEWPFIITLGLVSIPYIYLKLHQFSDTLAILLALIGGILIIFISLLAIEDTYI